MAKNSPIMWETWVWSLGWEDPLKEGMATYSSILACRIPMDCSLPGSSVDEVAKSRDWRTKHSTAGVTAKAGDSAIRKWDTAEWQEPYYPWQVEVHATEFPLAPFLLPHGPTELILGWLGRGWLTFIGQIIFYIWLLGWMTPCGQSNGSQIFSHCGPILILHS